MLERAPEAYEAQLAGVQADLIRLGMDQETWEALAEKLRVLPIGKSEDGMVGNNPYTVTKRTGGYEVTY